jgi:hypothetical protein
VDVLRAHGYERAAVAFFDEALEAAKGELDPNYASLRRVPLPEGASRVTVQINGARIISPQIAGQAEGTISFDDVRNGNLEEFHEVVAQFANAMLTQFMTEFFEYVGGAAEAVGNSMSWSAATVSWDDVLDAFEQVEWATDSLGIARPPRMHPGADAARVLEALPPMSAEQVQRWVRVQIDKQEENVSRGRGRRLR